MNDLIDIAVPVLLVIAFIAAGIGGIVLVFLASVRLTVSIYKHPDWKFSDAVDFLAYRSFITSVIFFSVIIATFLIPALIALPLLRDWIIATQLVVSVIAFIAANVANNLHLRRLRRPPKA